jgi:hypothetical protein
LCCADEFTECDGLQSTATGSQWANTLDNLRESFADYSLMLGAMPFHLFPYQLTDGNSQTPPSATASGEEYVRKPPVTAWEVSICAKEGGQCTTPASVKITAF